MRRVFGIVSVSPAVVIESKIEIIEEMTVAMVKEAGDVATFKINAKRGDKRFPIQSPDLCKRLGGVVLKNVESIKVDSINPSWPLLRRWAAGDLHVSPLY